jgi:hypothetical protein
MNRAEVFFRWFLRVVGSFALLAAPCALMPYSWMDAVHRQLGMGPLPAEPIVGYLARSTSAFYALQGGLLWLVSFDLPRHRLVLNYVGASFLVMGAFLWWVDAVEGMPAFWRDWEGPLVIVYGLVFLGLNRWANRAGGAAAKPDHADTV